MFTVIISVFSLLHILSGVRASSLQEFYDTPVDKPCILNITKSSLNKFTNILSQNPDLINVQAEFGWFENGFWTPYDIDQYPIPEWPKSNMPLEFIFRLPFGRRGEALGTLPDVVFQLSLQTLSPGVYWTNLQFDFDPTLPRQGACHEFINTTNDWENPQSTWNTFNFIAKTIINVTLETSASSFLVGDQLYVCQQAFDYQPFLKYPDLLCIASDFGQLPMNATRLHGSVTYKTLQNTVIYATVFLIMFCPLAILLLLQRKYPPKVQGTRSFISKNTDLPVGLKYILIYWTPSNSTGKKILNCSRACLPVAGLPLVIFSCGFGVYLFEFYVRIIFSLFPFPCLFILLQMIYFIIVNNFKPALVQKVLSALCEEDDAQRKYMLPFVKLPKQFQIPKHPIALPKLSVLLYYCSLRMNLILNYKLWIYFLQKMRKDVKNFFCSVPVLWHFMFLPISLPIMAVYILVGVFFNLVPAMYFFYQYLFKFPQCFNKCIATFVFFYNLLTVLSVSYFIFYCFFFIATIMVFTFIGLVINASTFNQILIMIISLVGYVAKSVLDIYDTYHKLLEITVDKASNIDKLAIESGEENLTQCEPLTSRLNGYSDVFVEETLFWFVVEKCRPLRMKVSSTVMKIVVAVSVAYFGIKIIFWTHKIQQINDASITLATLIAIIITPKLIEYVKSSASVKQDKELFAQQVEQAVKDYQLTSLWQGTVNLFSTSDSEDDFEDHQIPETSDNED